MTGDTILLIGLDVTKQNESQIKEPARLKEVEDWYGAESIFLEPYRILTETFGAESISIMNLDAWDDLKEDPELFEQYNFTYILPICLRLSDSYDDLFENKQYFYSQLLTWMTDNADSIVILSGIHASNYNTLTEYLDHEKEELEEVQPYFFNLQRQNCIYVSNNLRNWKHANVILAGLLLGDIGEYPDSDVIGPAWFDMDASDLDYDLVWFQNHFLRDTTVENLKNFASDSFIKNIMVDRILRYIRKHWPDMNQYIGTAFTEYKAMKIAEEAQQYLQSLKDWIIYDFTILSVTSIQNPDSTIGIHIHYEIWPKFTTERYVDEVVL